MATLILPHPLFYRMEPAQKAVVFFDGFCNLCSSSVQFIIRHDPKEYFAFASLQSDYAKHHLLNHHPALSGVQSVVLKTAEGKVFTKSSAALHIARRLSGVWPVVYAFIVLPAGLRNVLYDFIAARRYSWFGKKESCWLPTPDLRRRFLDQG